jgi:3',5'-cyclic AMP phosphodiesterase CpdA
MLIVQISDIHMAEVGKLTYGFVPMAENLERCVNSINALTMPPDVVLLSGDVTNDFLHSQAENAARILGKLTCPYYLVPGNHDNRDVLWQVFGNAACPAMVDGFINYVIEDYPLRIIGLDSLYLDHAGGQLCPTRANWLEACLQAGGTRPTVIFMHHPPLNCGVPETDQDGFDGADRLADIVAKYPNIQRILCGHIHLLTHARWHGTIVTTAPSMGMQLTLDLTQAKPSEMLLSNPAYLLHYWTPDKILITHSIELNTLNGPHTFAHH